MDNCTEILLEGDNVTVTCYKYVFAIGTAIGVSGGFITALGLIMSAVAGFWLFWYDLIKKKGSAFFFCVLLQYTIAFSVPVIIILVTLVIPNDIQTQPHVVFQVICLITTFSFSFLFPWWQFSQISDKKKTKTIQ